MAKKMKRKELGKGLGALLSTFSNDPDAPTPPQEVVQKLTNAILNIPLDAIEKNPFQPRKDFDAEALELLKNSIETHGLIQPITVRSMGDNTFQLISGERRWKASKMAGLTEVPAYVRVVNDSQEMVELSLVENIHRADLNPLEIAFTYDRLIQEHELTQQDLSARVGLSRVAVNGILSLLKLPPSIQKALKDREISRGHAITLGRVKDLSLQLSLLDQLKKEGHSVRKLEQLIDEYKQPKVSTPTSPDNTSEQYQEIRNELRDFLGSKVEIKAKKNGKGQIVIPFKNLKDFNRIHKIIDSDFR